MWLAYFIFTLTLKIFPNCGKVQPEPSDRAFAINMVARYDTDLAIFAENIHPHPIAIDQPAQFRAVGDPVPHFLLRYGQTVGRGHDFDHKFRAELWKASAITAGQRSTALI